MTSESQAADVQRFLEPTSFLDFDNPEVTAFAESVCTDRGTALEEGVRLYYAVRDGIRYNPYTLDATPESMRASDVLKRGQGFCVAKAVLLAATCRYRNIPARLGFADVRNHLSTRRLTELMQTDLFVWHGYVEMLLEGRWVKATPAFNLSLCQNFHVRPLEFDGKTDSVFHEFDTRGNRHMEYVADHGWYADLPYEILAKAYRAAYPSFFEELFESRKNDFSREALQENRPGSA